MMLPTPSSTLFPYTTLFRSRPDIQAEPAVGDLAAADDPGLGAGLGRVGDQVVGGKDQFLTGQAQEMAGDVQLVSLDLDRKSTRLNSSHANISYAVFCLKKKT